MTVICCSNRRCAKRRSMPLLSLMFTMLASTSIAVAAPVGTSQDVYELAVSIDLGNATPRDAWFSPDGETLGAIVFSRDFYPNTRFKHWDRDTGTQSRVEPQIWSNPPFVAVSKDGARLAIGEWRSMDAPVQVIDSTSGAPVARLSLSGAGALYALAINDDGTKVAAILDGAWKDKLIVWDVASSSVDSEFNVDALDYLSFSPDSKSVLVAGYAVKTFGAGNALAHVWALDSGRRTLEIERAGAFNSAEFSPDGQFILTANHRNGASASVWEVTSGREVRTLPESADFAWSATYSADGSRIVTTESDFAIRVWNASTGALLAKLAVQPTEYPGGLSARMSPDGSSLIAVSRGDRNHVVVWDNVEVRRAAEQTAFASDLSGAESGDVDAMIRTAEAYRAGRGVAANGEVAKSWLTRAADLGSAEADARLASLLLSGDMGRQDCATGGERLRKAIASGSVEAGARLDAVLSPLGGRQGAEALTPQIQADLLEAQIIEVLTRKEYPAFLANLCALEALGHAERLPVETRRELLYHRAVGLRAAGKPSAALAALNQYLNEAGNAGASYTQAIQMLRPLQEEARR
jgi:WD40 repeat protein